MTDAKSGASDSGPRYEVRDANVRRLVQLGLSLCLVIALVLLGVARLIGYLTSHQPQGRPVSPLATASDLPPQPRLQIAPRLDLAQKRNADDAALNSYAWIDRPSGTIRIPIDRAMQLLADRARTSRNLTTTHAPNHAVSSTPRHKER
jgi:hypothetical protein